MLIKKKVEYAFLLAPMVTGYLSSAISGDQRNSGINVQFRPPGYVFGIVWPILYLLLGCSWIVSSRVQRLNSLAYGCLTLLLSSWIVVYTKLQNKKGGVYIILASLMAALTCFASGNAMSKMMVAPLIGWLIFAMMMNATEVQVEETKALEMKLGD